MHSAQDSPNLIRRLSRWTGEFADAAQEQLYRQHCAAQTRRRAMWVLGLGGLAFLVNVVTTSVYYTDYESTDLPLRAAVALLGLALCWRLLHEPTRPGDWIEAEHALLLFSSIALIAMTAIVERMLALSEWYPYVDFFRGLHLMGMTAAVVLAPPLAFRWRVLLGGSFVVAWWLLCLAKDDPVTFLITIMLCVIGGYSASLVRHLNALRRQTYLAAERERQQRLLVERASEELRQTQHEIVLREKMAAVGSLTAGVTHEVSNPANFSHAGAQIVGRQLQEFRAFLYRLADDEGGDIEKALGARIDELDAQLATVLQGTVRIRDLVTVLRVFARSDDAPQVDAMLANTLRGAVETAQARFRGGPTIAHAPGFDAVVRAWHSQVEQAVVHLLDNACEAVLRRGVNDSVPEPAVRMRTRIDGDWLAIEVEDHGCGMSQDVRDRAFEPFFTTKTVGEGAGLGLSVAFETARRHGGEIALDSTGDSGTRATMRLPLACIVDAEAPAAAVEG